MERTDATYAEHVFGSACRKIGKHRILGMHDLGPTAAVAPLVTLLAIAGQRVSQQRVISTTWFPTCTFVSQEAQMLKIVQSATTIEQRWILYGHLTGPWVDELRLSWERRCLEAEGRRRVVDLRDVTFIDESGEGLLQQMCREGAEFIAGGVETQDMLANLTTSEERPLRKFLAHLVNECCAQQGRTDLKEGSK
ncbi:MAG TPA: hypothetical protein VFA65_09980 [Bryobacteraceae bacterium]|nr:hypothetical protein [Bryobacteraceae bacterium]